MTLCIIAQDSGIKKQPRFRRAVFSDSYVRFRSAPFVYLETVSSSAESASVVSASAAESASPFGTVFHRSGFVYGQRSSFILFSVEHFDSLLSFFIAGHLD